MKKHLQLSTEWKCTQVNTYFGLFVFQDLDLGVDLIKFVFYFVAIVMFPNKKKSKIKTWMLILTPLIKFYSLKIFSSFRKLNICLKSF